MVRGANTRSRNARILLAITAAVAAAAIVAAGMWIGAGSLGLLDNPTPPIYYITLPPGSTDATPDATPDASPTPSAVVSVGASPDASPAGSPGSSPTTRLTSRPPTPTPVLANLKVTGIGGATSFFCGEPISFHAVVINDGPVATTGTAVLTLRDTYGGHESYWTATTIPILGSGAHYSAAFTITINSGCGSDHVTTFSVDPGNSVPESNNLDNVYAWPHYVELAGPNIRVTHITTDPYTPECAVGFDVTLTVTNRGSLPALDSTVRVVDRVGTTELIPAKMVSFPSLPAHSSADVTVHLTVMSHCGEHHQIMASSDYIHRIAETDETDNTSYWTYLMNP